MSEKAGTEQTKQFYNEIGWKKQNGQSVDRHLFGVKEDGPIRVELHRLHLDRIRSALLRIGTPIKLLECGCGGNPEREFIDLCTHYTGVDFSDTGLDMARSSFADVRIPHEFRTVDVCALPFEDGAYDAVYSAHMIYHIQDPLAQDAVLRELVRVVRHGGVIVLIVANPRPLAFPMRFARRLAADTPMIGSILNRLRMAPGLPYKPMPIGWMRRRLSRSGPVEFFTHGLPSTKFNQEVTEYRGVGKLLWKSIRWLEIKYPKLSAYLGNYVVLICRKVSISH